MRNFLDEVEHAKCDIILYVVFRYAVITNATCNIYSCNVVRRVDLGMKEETGQERKQGSFSSTHYVY